jgi:uncharacterized protein
MKRKIFSLISALLLCLILTVVCFASNPGYVTDGADLLTDSEERDLYATLAEISDAYGAQVAVVTVPSLDVSIDYYVNDLYDGGAYGYGSDKAGVLLLVCMNPREYRILSNGFAADAISSYDIDVISDAIVSYLSAGDYAEAFDTYAGECEYYLGGYINGFPFDFGANLILALIVGVVIALIAVSSMKAQLKSVRRQNQANAYVKSGSMNITRAGDYYMYRTVTRSPKPKSNSSSSSSSGGSRNVGGGRF